MMRILTLAVVATLAACNSDIYVRDGVTDGDTFYLAPIAFVDSDPALQSWVTYSLVRSACQLQLGGDNPARSTSYGCEFSARNNLVDAWAEQRAEEPDIANDYLDTLLAVREAGFLDEYTTYYFRRDGWQIPVEVDLDAFSNWRARHLKHHRPQTRIVGSWNYKRTSARP